MDMRSPPSARNNDNELDNGSNIGSEDLEVVGIESDAIVTTACFVSRILKC